MIYWFDLYFALLFVFVETFFSFFLLVKIVGGLHIMQN